MQPWKQGVSNKPYVTKKLMLNVEGDIGTNIVEVNKVSLGLKGCESN